MADRRTEHAVRGVSCLVSWTVQLIEDPSVGYEEWCVEFDTVECEGKPIDGATWFASLTNAEWDRIVEERDAQVDWAEERRAA